MRTSLRNLIAVGALFAALLTACSPEKVGPKGNENDRPNLGLNESGHVTLNPTCSDSFTTRLQSSDNSFIANYGCGTQPCQPWGTAIIVNGVDSVAVYVTLAVGWYVDFANSSFEGESSFQFGADGRPTIDGDFQTTNVTELNKYTMFVHKDSIGMDANGCFSAAIRLAVLKRNFLGAPDNASKRFLWAYNDSSTVVGNPHASISPYLTDWCWANCPEPTPGGPYPVDSCALVPEVPTYTCSNTGNPPVEFCTYNLDVRCNQTFNIRNYIRNASGGGAVNFNNVLFTYTEVGADDPTVNPDWHLADFNSGTPVTVVSSDFASGKGNHGQGEYRIYVYRVGQTTYDDHMTIRTGNNRPSSVNSSQCSNSNSGGSCGGGNSNSNPSITSTTTRCITNSGSLGTVNFSGNGRLVIESGVTATASINASNGATIIVNGTLNLTGTASYSNNVNIFVAEGGVLNRTGNLTFGSSSGDLVNHGTVTITGILTSRGFVGNTGTLTAANMTLNGNGVFYNSGTTSISGNLLTSCSTSTSSYGGGNNCGGGYGGGNYGGGCNHSSSCNQNTNGGSCNGGNNCSHVSSCSHNNSGGGYGGGGNCNNNNSNGGGSCNNGGGGSTPASCTNFISNCGNITAANITIGAGSRANNFCTLIGTASITLNGSLENYGIAVGGNTTGAGFANNGNLSLHAGSVIVSKAFNWGTARTITVDGKSWIIAASSTLGNDGNVDALGTTGSMRIPVGSILYGNGQLELVDVDLYGQDDVPATNAIQNISIQPGSSAAIRQGNRVTDVPLACSGANSI